jgi:hypothetical protein
MKDEIILRMLQDTCQKLENVFFPVETPRVVPTYNALLTAVKTNHPDEPYLSALTLSESGAASPEELKILFGQLRILLEALMEEKGELDAQAPYPRDVARSR